MGFGINSLLDWLIKLGFGNGPRPMKVISELP